MLMEAMRLSLLEHEQQQAREATTAANDPAAASGTPAPADGSATTPTTTTASAPAPSST